jgi:pimeloyl-ACP methyl ester carboxylesterase
MLTSPVTIGAMAASHAIASAASPSCPVLIMQGTADPLISMHSPRFLAFIPNAQFRWLYGLSHVPISDDPELVTGLILDFISTTGEGRVPRESLPAPA